MRFCCIISISTFLFLDYLFGFCDLAKEFPDLSPFNTIEAMWILCYLSFFFRYSFFCFLKICDSKANPIFFCFDLGILNRRPEKCFSDWRQRWAATFLLLHNLPIFFLPLCLISIFPIPLSLIISFLVMPNYRTKSFSIYVMFL